MSGLYNFAKSVCPILFSVLTPIKYVGEIPKIEGRAIICSNHLSAQDPVYLGLAHERPLHFMAKAELFKFGLADRFFRSLGAFPVIRGTGDSVALNTAGALLQNEDIVGIFIEGTRSKTGDFLRPKNGAAMLAYENNAPIVPMCITGQSGGKVRLFQNVYVSCGEPIKPSELGLICGTGMEFRRASRKIMEKIAQLRQLHLKTIEANNKPCLEDIK